MMPGSRLNKGVTMSHTVATTEAAATGQPRKRRRVFLWVFLAIQALFIIWLIAGGASAGGSIHASVAAQCLQQAKGMGMTQAQCISWLGGAAKTGTAIGAALIVVLWTVVDIILGISYGVYRLATRANRQAVA
jgi:hypothetical protein